MTQAKRVKRMRFLAPVLAGLVFSVLGLGAVGSTAIASPGATGRIAAMPSSLTPPVASGELRGVACVSATQCLAVGLSSGEAPDRSLAESWNGVRWTQLATPEKPFLAAIACPRTSLCQAVGSGGADRWNGAAWIAEKTPVVPGAGFNAISCPTSSRCVAVGIRPDGHMAVPLAETWNGSAWTVRNPANPAGALQAYLSSISCVSPSNCLAVGTYEYAASSFKTLAESWDGSTWHLLTMPALASTDALLSGVSCIGSTSCVAIGAAAPGTLAELWNGASWTVLPAPPGGEASAISCAAAASCMAIGGTTAESWNGIGWTSLATPPLMMNLNGISCASATRCMAVGRLFDAGSLAMSWNGSRWRAVRADHLDRLSGVSCTLAIRCMAAGSFLAPSDSLATLAQSWNGTSWRQRRTPAVADSELSDVSCVSAADCIAVGGQGPDSSLTLAEAWNGTAWRVTPTPNQGPGSELNGVSCRGGACVAIGFSFVSEVWNGATWRAVPVPHPGPFHSGGLTDVSCASATMCLLTGFYFTSVQGNGFSLAERWNGHRWRILHPPGIGLDTVSCTSASFCMAVSSDTAEIWNGKTWRSRKLPGSFGNGPGITGVSCASRSACMAVGSYLVGSGTQAAQGFNVAAFWNGSRWRRLATAGPGGGLRDVSCTAASRCMAVGEEPAGQVGTLTLAERWNGKRWAVLTTSNP